EPPLRRARPDPRMDDVVGGERARLARRRARWAIHRRHAHAEAFPAEVPGASRPAQAGQRGSPASVGPIPRGAAPVPRPRKPRLRFFWAAWCAVCKSALPEVAAFERDRGTPVVAITDEDPSRLEPFFAKHTGPFPTLVAQ